MQDHIRSVLALQHSQPSFGGYVRLPPDAKVTDRGIQYAVVYCNRDGAALRRMDETNATVTFTQAELHECLNRPGNPMTVEFNYFSERKAKGRLRGRNYLSELSPKDQDDVLSKEFVVRQFMRREAEYREQLRLARQDKMPAPPVVSRSRPSMLRILPEIAHEWRDLRLRAEGGTATTTYRKKSTIAPFEPKPSTVKAWIRTFELSDHDPLSLKNQYNKDRPEYFTADEYAHLHKALTEACSRTKPDLAEIHRNMKTAIEAENKVRPETDKLRVPCEETLRNRYNAVPDMRRDLGRNGKDSARRSWQPEFGGIDVIRPFERLEFDEHETDLQTLLVKTKVWAVMSKAERKAVKRIRLTISAAICVASRSLACLHVSAEPPSLKSAMHCLEMITKDKTSIARQLGCETPWPVYGTPEVVATDSAVYFAHRPFRVAVNDMGSDIFLPPAGEAPFRGFIERWFLTFTHQMFNYFQGRTWGSTQAKGDYDAEAHANAVADQVAECIIRWAVDCYHNTPHGELNEATPLDRWFELARDHGVQPAPTGALRSHLFGTYVARLITKKGYRVAGLYYQSKQLQQIRRKNRNQPVMGRVNNHDRGSISVLTQDGWIEVPCVHNELVGVSIWQWLAAVERLKLFHKESAKASRQTMLDTFAWLKGKAEMAWLEAGLVSPVLTDEDYRRFENKMDREFDLVDGPVKGEPRPEGDWHPSDELFEALRIHPVVYAKAPPKQLEVEGRPPFGTHAHSGNLSERKDEPKLEGSAARRISDDIFDNE